MTQVLLFVAFLLLFFRMRKKLRRKRIQKQIMLIQREYMITCIAQHPQFAERANKLIAAEMQANMGVIKKCRLFIQKLKQKEREKDGV